MNTKKIDILIVDDEEAIRELLGEFVAMKGYQFSVAENGAQAYDLIKLEKPALVICDISMPGMSGLELLEKIRMEGFHSAMVMLTAHAEHTRVIEALRLGAIDYTTKPFDPSELLDKIDNWVEMGKRLQDLRDEETPISRGDTNKQMRMIELFQVKNKKVNAA